MGVKADGLQYGALPWRVKDGALQVLLVTSRETKRWVIPKGWPMDKLEPHEAAAQEAFEEAGVLGETAAEAIGDYPYGKRLKSGLVRACVVKVFALKVARHERFWPEKKERRRSWFAAHDAAERVAEPELAELIREFAGTPRG
jgi:8-oxo-dGTP pyrophosphatase MutT (NUDIX family)